MILRSHSLTTSLMIGWIFFLALFDGIQDFETLMLIFLGWKVVEGEGFLGSFELMHKYSACSLFKGVFRDRTGIIIYRTISNPL